jgi:hypothetical protein
MLKSWRAWLLPIAGLILLLFIFLVLASSLSFQTCMEETKDYYTREGLPYFFLKGLENCVGSYIIGKHAVITALATAVIAYFTYTLWRANQEQTKRHREVERAYISGGGPLDRNDPNKFLFTVNNYGKTPGVLLQYTVAFCPLNAISAIPAYDASDHRRTTCNERIAPGGIRETRTISSISIPSLPRPLLVYGRCWFEDIWKEIHTSGFVLVIDADRTHGHVPAGISRAYTDWN